MSEKPIILGGRELVLTLGETAPPQGATGPLVLRLTDVLRTIAKRTRLLADDAGDPNPARRRRWDEKRAALRALVHRGTEP